jgi:PAP2 superfamily C-terminal
MMTLRIVKAAGSTTPPAAPAAWWMRAGFIVLALGAWFWTQSLLGQRAAPQSGVGDVVHRWTAPVHDFLAANPQAANLLLVASSAVIDVVGLSLLAASVFGRTLRPFLGLLMLFCLRQICQGFCALPTPPGMIWHATGVPTLLVTYGVSNDLFFSGHTGLAVLGAVELARTGRKGFAALGVLIALFEAATVLVLRAHYTMDVFTGAVTALFVAELAARWAPFCDRALARLPEGKSQK